MVKEFGLPWIAHLLLHVFLTSLWGGIIRIKRDKLIVGILYIVTGGFIGILWLVDLVTLILKKDYTVAA